MKNRWSLVIHEVTEQTVNIWLGTLFHDCRKPFKVNVKITDKNSQLVATQAVLKADWERPFSDIKSQRFCKLVTFDSLIPGQDYKVVISEVFAESCAQPENILSTGTFTTLPDSIADMANGFTVGLGSCFYEEFDGGHVGLAYETLVKFNESTYKPHIKFMTGDQVYLDIGWDSLSVVPKEIRDRIANDYALHWQALRGALRNGATWFLSDDHEFWNNYPLVKGLSPFIQALRIPTVKDAWRKTAKDGVKNVQRTQPVRVFSIANELSFCLADLRAFRTKTNIMPEANFKDILNWVKGLTCPGVLVLSQPIMVKQSGNDDRNFVYYEKQYKKLIKALHDAEHDVVVLSGDVHHGRISTVQFPNRDNKLIEIVSSPMSNLSGISSIATSDITRNSRLKNFPPITVPGVDNSKISYVTPWKVTSEYKLFDLRYLNRRTKEHFCTLNFVKNNAGEIKVTVRAWLVREKDRKTGLPKQDWSKKPMEMTLT